MDNYLHYIYNDVLVIYHDFLFKLTQNSVENAKGSIMIFGMKEHQVT